MASATVADLIIATLRNAGVQHVHGVVGDGLEDPADLAPALRAALAHPGPALLDVITNRAELAMPPKITLKEAGGFSLWAAKAVMSGRGTELIELARTNTLSGFFR